MPGLPPDTSPGGARVWNQVPGSNRRSGGAQLDRRADQRGADGQQTMRIDAATIDDLIEQSGPRADALRKLDALIVAAAPQLQRRLFRGRSITMIGYGELAWRNAASSGVWPVIAVAPQKHQISMYVAAERDGVPIVQLHAGRLGRTDNGKNCVRFRKFEDLDRTALTALVQDAVASAAEQSRLYGRDCARPVE